MKPLESGDLLEDLGFYKVHVHKLVDTIETECGVVYKYQTKIVSPTTIVYELAYQVYVRDKLYIQKTCHKFMTKTAFKELLQESELECLKQDLDISPMTATLSS